MTDKNIAKSQVLSFAFLALPLSFVGIPIYLNISDFYARQFEINLALIGILLVFIRIIDSLQDPFVGYFSDALAQKKFSHKKIIILASSILCIAFYLVFNPPQTLSKNLAILWFMISLLVTYTCFNFTIINFESLAAIMAKNDQQRIFINSAKELFGLIGMIFAFFLPAVFVYAFGLQHDQIYTVLSLVFAGLMLFATFGLFRRVRLENEVSVIGLGIKIGFAKIFLDKKFMIFLGIFMLNSVAVSLPAANLNFYIRDVLQNEKNLGWFLSLYFFSACLFIPLWKFLANRFGMIRSWIFSIWGSVLTFSFSYFLTPETAQYFYAVCIFSGIFLGADLIMPPAILAKIISDKKEAASSYFSLWNLTAKLSLMIAASGSLIFLGFSGYRPGIVDANSAGLIEFFYAFLPCILKLFTIFNLSFFEKKFPQL